jgi:hypothetical protein
VACAIAPDYHKKKSELWSLVRGVRLKNVRALQYLSLTGRGDIEMKMLVMCSAIFIATVNISLVNASTNIIGTWVDTTDSDEFLTFRNNGTWEWTDNGGSSKSWGTWAKHGKRISAKGYDIKGNPFATTGTLSTSLYFPQFVELNGARLHPETFKRR